MIMTHIRYSVKAEYAAQNKANISRVMEELRALRRTAIRYSVFADEEANKVFSALESFKAFQAALFGSHPEVPPSVNTLALVGSTSNLL